jgi:hypothetical protein
MCMLRVVGCDFDVDQFLSDSSIQPTKVYHKGEPRLPATQPKGPTHPDSGFNAEVSGKEWDDLAGQIQDALTFVADHHAELDRLRSFHGVDGIQIDFPIYLRIGRNDVAVQGESFPAALAFAAGSHGIDLAFSIWPPPNPSVTDGTG